jgi:hypothetical protein
MKMKLYAMMVIAILAALQTQAALVLHYDFNGTGSTVSDLSGNGYDGTIISPGVAGGDNSGVTGSSTNRAFDNSGAGSHADSSFFGFVNVPNTVNNSYLAAKTQFTVTFWMNPQQILGNNARLLEGRTLSLLAKAGDAIEFKMRMSDGNFASLTPGSTPFPNVNEWNFVALVFDSNESGGNYMKVYSGDKASSAALVAQGNGGIITSGMLTYGTGSTAFMIGNKTGTTNAPFDGLIDNLRIYDTALDQATIESTIRSPEAVPEPGSVLMVMVGAGVLFIVRRIRARA